MKVFDRICKKQKLILVLIFIVLWYMGPGWHWATFYILPFSSLAISYMMFQGKILKKLNHIGASLAVAYSISILSVVFSAIPSSNTFLMSRHGWLAVPFGFFVLIFNKKYKRNGQPWLKVMLVSIVLSLTMLFIENVIAGSWSRNADSPLLLDSSILIARFLAFPIIEVIYYGVIIYLFKEKPVSPEVGT